MNIFLNGQKIDTKSQTLKDLLLEQSFDIKCIATAINSDFMPRKAYETKVLEENMHIEVVSPMQRG
ncbi:thiamine biosynthesis protein ThiS [Acinetobacter nectaris CIP 110549]|uniref:Thiamine biosynthesis protein ThiS n=1 Tax=Acinetobacter nectaris CIP 110549 TaxID=1392540 RepID=V2THY5_9GAMM|nr:sulfur carrier protein ThiS [Acinetobacter nectaris]ESK37296.1 thiamine biosynthesis protein ThiS [Acinetobacter nectaris CIP 110549]